MSDALKNLMDNAQGGEGGNQDPEVEGVFPHHDVADPPSDGDHIEHGSDAHAALLGIVKGEDGNWELEDITIYPPDVTEEYLRRVLESKVRELTTPPPEIQSHTPGKPGYAPDIWYPRDIPPDGFPGG